MRAQVRNLRAPNVAHSYQDRWQPDPGNAARWENWAVTGSTSLRSGDTGGPFNSPATIKDTHVASDAGANPILSSMLQIKLALVPVTNGLCDSTLRRGDGRAYPVSHVGPRDQQWAQKPKQTPHLRRTQK